MKNHMWHLLFIFLLVALWSGNLVYATGCADRPCQNGGVCFDQPNNDFICLCIVGFTGRTCIGDVVTPTPAAETMAPTTVQASTTKQATTTVPTTIKETTEASTKQPTTQGPSSTTSSSRTSSTEAAVSEKKSTDSSDNNSGDQDGDGDSGDVTSTTMVPNDQENTSKDKVSGDRGNYKWFLFLILLVLLVTGSLVTLWAIRRSAKSHGKYNPNAAFMAYALDAERAPPPPSPSTNGSFGGPVD